MDRYRPSDGRRASGVPVNLNGRGFKVGERVLYQQFGIYVIGTIAQLANAHVLIGPQPVEYRRILGRMPASADDAALSALLADLRALDQAHQRSVGELQERWSTARAAALERAGVK